MARIALAGFFGRGNAGDEALLQCTYEALSPHHEVAIGANATASHPAFRSWYPYDGCRIYDDASIGAWLALGAQATVIGGGGLHVGFAAHLALATRFAGGRTVLAGTDALDFLKRTEVERSVLGYLDGFDLVALRFRAGVEALRRLGLERVQLGADWAFALRMAAAPEQRPAGDICCVVVREWNAAALGQGFRFHLHLLLHGLRARGLFPLLVPFSPEDERLARSLAGLLDVPVLPIWWNPRAIKGLFAQSAMVVSVGRLHPLIFAAPLDKPVCYLAPALDGAGPPAIGKIACVTEELGIAAFRTVEDLLRGLDAGEIRRADPEAVAEAEARLAGMVADVLEVLG
ncbi:polysaccharide pyruvyl transferase family protein [Falsiroseomonas sp. E2-1-a20]|uniref:polysaccharide pyruvyl transferase family protein n=1 Tax=Falsiroseomonas sp. E2-1-a20 TaxID=3239300 RepID=UPI003F2D2F8B